MSKIKDLKLNPDNNLNIISILELFSPNAKSKYTDTLLRLMKSTPNIKGHIKEVKTYINSTFDFATGLLFARTNRGARSVIWLLPWSNSSSSISPRYPATRLNALAMA